MDGKKNYCERKWSEVGRNQNYGILEQIEVSNLGWGVGGGGQGERKDSIVEKRN